MYEIFLRLLAVSGVTTADVCRAIGESETTFSNWKKRDNLIGAKTGIKIAAFFGVTLDYLYGADTPEAPTHDSNEEILLRGYRAADESTKRNLLLIARDADLASRGKSATSTRSKGRRETA